MLNFILFVCKEKAVPQMAEAIDVGWVKGKEVTVLFYLCMYLVALGPSCGTQDQKAFIKHPFTDNAVKTFISV